MAFPRYFPLIYISPKQKLATFFNKSLIKQQLSPTHLRVWMADCRCHLQSMCPLPGSEHSHRPCRVPLLGAAEKEPWKGQFCLHTGPLCESLQSPGRWLLSPFVWHVTKGPGIWVWASRLQWFPETSAPVEPHCRGTAGRGRVQRGAHQPGWQR